ncbi:unnamed protein product, partial [Polarella glacialis]
VPVAASAAACQSLPQPGIRGLAGTAWSSAMPVCHGEPLLGEASSSGTRLSDAADARWQPQSLAAAARGSGAVGRTGLISVESASRRACSKVKELNVTEIGMLAWAFSRDPCHQLSGSLLQKLLEDSSTAMLATAAAIGPMLSQQQLQGRAVREAQLLRRLATGSGEVLE